MYICMWLFVVFFFLHIQFTHFQTKSLKSPGTYISERTWDSKSHYKKPLQNNWRATGCVNLGVICANFWLGDIFDKQKG